jgi:hypothetical protein
MWQTLNPNLFFSKNGNCFQKNWEYIATEYFFFNFEFSQFCKILPKKALSRFQQVYIIMKKEIQDFWDII